MAQQEQRALGEVRRRALFTIRELSELAGVSKQTIVDLEHGRTDPQLRTIKLLSQALNVDPLDVEEFAAVILRTNQ